MSNAFARNMAVEQRRRLVGAVMEHFEKKVAPAIPIGVRNQVAQQFRDKVMSAVGQYHDVVLDMLKSTIDDGSVVNEEALALLRDLGASVGALREDVADLTGELLDDSQMPTSVSKVI